MKRLSIHSAAALALCLCAFAMSALVSRQVFERLPHLEDEYAYLFQARTLARGDLVIETPQPRRAYWQPFVVDKDGVRFGKYTPGWAIFLAGGVIAGQEWMVNALLAALIVALVYRIGCDLFGRDTGLIGAALAAFSPMALLLNATLMGHTAALFCGALALWGYLRLEKVQDASNKAQGLAVAWGWALLCGLALGLLAANRPITGAAFALPLIARAVGRLLGGVARAAGFHECADLQRRRRRRSSCQPLHSGLELRLRGLRGMRAQRAYAGKSFSAHAL
jgi:hypothetical protein